MPLKVKNYLTIEYKKRQEKIDELKNRLELLNDSNEKFKGSNVWLSELEELSDAIKKGKKFDLTEEEFIDIYLTGFKNQLNSFANITQMLIAVAMIMQYSAGDKDKWYWKMMYKSLFKIKREFLFDYDPNQMLSFFSQGLIPVIASLGNFTIIFSEFYKEMVNPKKGKPIAATLKTIPIIRELHYWLSIISKDYAKMLDIKQPKPETLI